MTKIIPKVHIKELHVLGGNHCIQLIGPQAFIKGVIPENTLQKLLALWLPIAEISIIGALFRLICDIRHQVSSLSHDLVEVKHGIEAQVAFDILAQLQVVFDEREETSGLCKPVILADTLALLGGVFKLVRQGEVLVN